MRAFGWIAAATFLAGCGADGDPEYPRERMPPSTTVETTVGVGNSGVHSGTRVTTRSGPFVFGVGIGL
ncbi:hypothetical protein K1T73_02955 [Roseovarius sp. SCSIO 43702]|uniref:hypothetical protein n=1 Tax=Roseovarius sp. SCSIO 43702 TaxID=2823043 RepID=UPI001C72A8EA|nr:hypothetical protein [Roseovarius sp. SCSIO 43702]QYX57377.1 hypothetical protein K1T73_02955 [Roseovarius sp. SCSIO 43702]